jgi:prolyl-tRNA editing enzyme YbaK/EbsC (Cys-tRNA(Pro) deacylase)
MAQVTEMPGSTRTAADAAKACGCDVAQIAKSLIFRDALSGKAVLAIVAGDRRVHEKRLGRLIHAKLERADPDFVREVTGFAIGGVPPFGHAMPSIVVMDESLRRFERIWAAAGTPRCVFETSPAELEKLSGATVLDPS